MSSTEGTSKQLRELLSTYKNVIYFSGHSHLQFELQKLAKNANISEATDSMCRRVHIASCAKPRNESGKYILDGSQGYVMDVYENGIVLKGRDFIKNKNLTIATYAMQT